MYSRRRRTGQLRRGTTYILVLGAASIVATIGLSGLFAVRLEQRAVAQANDWNEAGNLALAAVELGITRVNADPNWRSTYTNNVECPPINLDRGTLSFKLVDAALGLPTGDGSLNNNTYDPVRVYGYGRVGNAVRVYSVQLNGATPIDALRTCLTVSGELDIEKPVFASGALSTNGQVIVRDTVAANVEAQSIDYEGGIIEGAIRIPSAAKAMPDLTVLDAYKRLATPITWPGGDWKMTAPLLSATTNPFGASPNPQGIYSLTIPADKKLELEIAHIKGTLIIECGSNAEVIIERTIFWESHSLELPILLMRENASNDKHHKLKPQPGFITEGGQTYLSEMRGLVHLRAYSTASHHIEVGKNANFRGTLILDGKCDVRDDPTTFNWHPTLYANPPVGYTTGHLMRVSPGSMRWESGS